MAHAERVGKYWHAKAGRKRREIFPQLADTHPNLNYLARINPSAVEHLGKCDVDYLRKVAAEIESKGLKGSLDTVSFKKLDIDTTLLGAITEFCNIRNHLSHSNSPLIFNTLDEISFKEFYQGLKINEQILRENRRGLKNVRDVLMATYQILKEKERI